MDRFKKNAMNSLKKTLLPIAAGAIYTFTIIGCSGGEFFDQLSSSTSYSGYFVVASASAVNTAPGAVTLFDQNGNFVRNLSDYYANAELPSGLAVVGSRIYAAIEGADRLDFLNISNGAVTSYTYSGLSSTPLRQAVADSFGNLYVVESNTAQIEKFDSSLTRSGTPFIATTGPCPLSAPWGVAYIPSTNQIAVTNSSSTRLNIYDATTSNCSSSVNNAGFGTTSTGIIYHSPTNKLVWARAGDSAIMYSNIDGSNIGTAYLNTSRISVPYTLAADSNGYVYVASAGQDTIEKFSFTGTTMTPVLSGPLIGPSIYTQNPTQIVVIP